MTYIILTQPHPLDAIWSHAKEKVDDAQTAIDNLPEPYTNDEIDALVDKHIEAAIVVLALPARDVDDCIFKLDLTGPLNGAPLADFDRSAITAEALALLSAAIARGTKLKTLNPEFLEGVTL